MATQRHYGAAFLLSQSGILPIASDTQKSPASGPSGSQRRRFGLGARADRDGQDGMSLTLRGPYDVDAPYECLDVVEFGRDAFVARRNGAGLCPGEDWLTLSVRGPKGDKRDPGPRGTKGDSGPPARSVVDAVRCAIEVQSGLAERNTGLPPETRIEYRVGIHLGNVVEENDGDLMGDGVNIAARLEGVAKPGGICLSEDAYRQVKSRLDLKVSDLGPVPLKNIAEPMRAYALTLDRSVAKSDAARAEKSSGPALPDKPSIAVLPFQNMSGDPEQDCFADGMVEDIVTGLSRTKWLFVIARNSSFVYKGKAVDVRQVERDLGVRYGLEGGVRKSGNRLRVTAQLIDSETGAHLWANRYDGDAEEVFDFQDRITDSVVGIVEPSVQRSEIERARRNGQSQRL
jgi:TolB-like protein/class 3 adenylate cyclase